MKKLFTLVICTFLAGLSTLRAESYAPQSITVYVTDEDNVKFNNISSTLAYADGVFTLSNWVNTENTSVSFKFNQDIAVDSVSAIEFTGDNIAVVYEDYYRFKNANNKYTKGKVINADTTLVVRFPCVYNDGTDTYTYIMRLDKEEYGYDYYAYFTMTGKGEDDEWLQFFDYEFYFNAPEVEKAPVSLGNVDVEIYDENSKEVAKGYESELTVSADGVYTLSNFIDSGVSLSFTFDSSVEVDDYTKVVPTGNVSAEGSYYDILTATGGNPTGKLYALEGDGVTNVYYPYIYADAKAQYSYVMKLDKAEYGYEYYACFNFSGYDADNEYLDDYYLEFYFNGKDSGVATVVVDDENAPVEYYNLNGQRVVNPENGLFIRKQGSKVSKVIIR